MRGLPDYHVHTNTTDDAVNTIDEMAAAAAAKGLSEIMITDHFVIDEPGFRVSLKELENHALRAAEIEKATGLKVLVGIEMDFFEGMERDLEKVIQSFDFDMVTGAAHFVEGLALADEPHAVRFFRKYSPVECYRKSFEALTKAAASGMFDVLAHIDIVKKYSINTWGEVPYHEYEDSFEKLIAAMKKTGTGFEVNCRGFDHQTGTQYPSALLMKKLLSAGIDTVTIGSDSHSTNLVGADLDKGAQALRAAGCDHLTLFRQRKAINVPLSEFGY